MAGFLFSLIIPTCNRTNDLIRCLKEIFPQAADLGNCEILVSDDGSSDETRQAVATCFHSVIWQQGPRRGPAANRNLGASRAQGNWLIFLDDDCIPVKNYLQAYHEAIIKTDPHVALEGATWRIGQLPSLLWEAPHNPYGGTLISCNFAISKSFFNQIGRFDERYPGAAFEDTEFAARFLASGGRFEFVSQARIDHPIRRVPSAKKLANRWEPRVIYALDIGASPLVILWRLPWHALRIIQGRLSNASWTADYFRAIVLFISEWFHLLFKTPGWIIKASAGPRSQFWLEEVRKNGPAPKYGF